MAYTGGLGSFESMPANIVLAADEAAAGGTEFDRNSDSILALVQTVVANFYSESVESTLVLVQDVIASLPEETSSTLALVQTVVTNIQSQSVTSALALVQTAQPSFINAHAESVLALAQTVVQPFYARSVTSTLSLISDVDADGSEQTYAVTSFLGLTQTTFEHFALANRSITSHLEFVSEEEGPGLTQAVNFVWELEASNIIALSDLAYRIYVVEDTLELIQTVVVASDYPVETELGLEHEVARELILGRSLESTLALTQAVAYEIERTDTLCTYTPFVGTNGDGDATTPPSTTEPVLGSALLTLTHPYVTPTTTLELRNPDFGNQTTLNYSRVFGETRGGTLIVYSDPLWPKIKTLTFQLNALTEAQTESLLDFLGDSLGQEVGLLDWENRQWRGIILTPDAEVTDNGECNKTVSLQFEGELV